MHTRKLNYFGGFLLRKRSRFEYKIIGNTATSLAELIQEELNKGLTFTLTEKKEEIVHLNCKGKDWVEVSQDNDWLEISVEDSFFSGVPPITKVLVALWSNLMDFGSLKLTDIEFSEFIHQSMISRLHVSNILTNFDLSRGPFFGIQIKPSYETTLDSKCELATQFVRYGGTFLKEDETYFIEREHMLTESTKIQGILSSFSETSYYIPNITPWCNQFEFIQALRNSGIRIGLIAYLIVGLNSVFKSQTSGISYWGHRVGYEIIRNQMSMQALVKLALYSGISFIHIGTPLFSSVESVESTKDVYKVVNDFPTRPIPVFTKTSREITGRIVSHFGRRIILMACGSIRTKGKLDEEKMLNWMEEL